MNFICVHSPEKGSFFNKFKVLTRDSNDNKWFMVFFINFVILWFMTLKHKYNTKAGPLIFPLHVQQFMTLFFNNSGLKLKMYVN